MAHYPHIFSINRLHLAVHLGYYDAERKKPQPVEVTLRLYFPEAPACARDDFAKFIDADSINLADDVLRPIPEPENDCLSASAE